MKNFLTALLPRVIGVQSDKIVVYMLKERGEDEILYVGMSNNPVWRLYQHIKSKRYTYVELHIVDSFSTRQFAHVLEEELRELHGFGTEKAYYERNGENRLKTYWAQFTSEERSNIARNRALLHHSKLSSEEKCAIMQKARSGKKKKTT